MRFYKGDFQSPVGSIDELHTWKGQYAILEMNHEYIQWLFPNYFASQFNPNSQALTKDEARAFCNDPAIARKYIKSYELFLDFLGLKLKDRFTGQVERAAGGEHRLHAALVGHPHNQLRVRRVLASLAVTGFSRYMEPLVQHLLKEASGEKGVGDKFSRSQPVLAELQGAPILEHLRAYSLRSTLFRANTRAHESEIEESVFFTGRSGRDPRAAQAFTMDKAERYAMPRRDQNWAETHGMSRSEHTQTRNLPGTATAWNANRRSRSVCGARMRDRPPWL